MIPTPAPLAWLFVDMNSFFAAIEQHLRPALRGRPVGVIPVQAEGTCIIAASREAKTHGIRTGTCVREARQRCPAIRLIVARPAEYVHIHHAVFRSIERCAPIHKAYSIDEWAIRLVGHQRSPESALALGRRIQSQLLADFSPVLTCSIGIAPTRLLAKIASDLHKPDGLTLLPLHELPDRLEHQSPQALCGIGPGLAARLEQRGVRTVRDLWNQNREQAIALWGSITGAHWWAGFHGIDEPEMPTRRRSMSHASVLAPRFRNETAVHGILTRLICRLGVRLRADHFLAGTLGIQVSFLRGERFSASLELPHVQDTNALLRAFARLWERRPLFTAPPVQVNAVVSGLTPAAQVAECLFEQDRRMNRLSRAMDAITERWGGSSIYLGSMHECRHPMDEKIAFGRIPPSLQGLRAASSDGLLPALK